MTKLANVTFLITVTLLGQEAPANKTLRVTISSQTPVIQDGAPLQVDVIVTNISAEEVDMGESVSEQSGQSNNCPILVFDEKGNAASKRHYEHEELASWKILFRSMKPQESLTDHIVLSRQYLLTPGKYSIRVLRWDPESTTSNPLYAVSNLLTVEVTARPTEKQQAKVREGRFGGKADSHSCPPYS